MGPLADGPFIRARVDALRKRGGIFKKAALDQVDAIATRPLPLEGRERVQGLVFSIDGQGTRDLDNALSYRRLEDGSFILGVHATDLSHWIRPGSPLDFAARLRVETAYQSNRGRYLPMLPVSVTEELFSLRVHRRRLAKSVELHFSAEGEFLESRIFNSHLINRRAIDPAVGQRLRDDPGSRYSEALGALTRAALGLRGQTTKKQRAASLSLDKALGLVTVKAASEVGEALFRAGIATSYRNQDTGAASYGEAARGHQGLGVDAYARFTGPMRRYADIDVQRAIDVLLDGTRVEGRRQTLDARLRSIQLERAHAHAARGKKKRS